MSTPVLAGLRQLIQRAVVPTTFELNQCELSPVAQARGEYFYVRKKEEKA
jgi:hypothetical protein